MIFPFAIDFSMTEHAHREEEDKVFCGINAKITEKDYVAPGFLEHGKELFEKQKRDVSKALADYVLDDGLLSEERIESDWFPNFKADVFLSHSHKDEELVIAFAGWLHSIFGITSFIDSCVWGYSDELLKLIDKEYCVSKRKPDGSIDTYDYQKRNQSTAHVHMILNTALMKMIDATECLMFINTPNSLLLDDVISGAATTSPWIYSELLTSRLIRHKKLSEYRQQTILEHAERYDALGVEYNVSIDHLTEVSDGDWLYLWANCKGKGAEITLDTLYKYRGIINAREKN